MFEFLLNILDWLLFIPCAIVIIYMLFFAIAGSRSKETWTSSRTRKQARFLIITTVCPTDTRVEKTIKSVIAQEYNEKNFDMLVVADNLSPITNMKLMQYPITVLRTESKNGTKLTALQYAIQRLSPLKIYDMVILLDPDEIIGTQFLQKVNSSFQLGYRMMQAHRTDIDRETSAMILATSFEEINNTVFRIGHNNMGLSSALIGSGLCAEFNWFRENIMKLSSEFEEKEMEALILKQRIYIDYLEDAIIYVDHAKELHRFNKQRRRWTMGQLISLRKNIRLFIPALFRSNYDLADKIFQWMMLPRTMVVCIICIMSIAMPFFSWIAALKWWVAATFFLLMCAIATPDYIVDERWVRAYGRVPILIAGTLLIPFHIIWRLLCIIFVRKKKEQA